MTVDRIGPEGDAEARLKRCPDCGGYWQVFENGTFCQRCDRRKITPLYLTDQPGGKRAIAHGCTCPEAQPGALQNRFVADKDCALHGLPIANSSMTESQRIDPVLVEKVRGALEDSDWCLYRDLNGRPWSLDEFGEVANAVIRVVLDELGLEERELAPGEVTCPKRFCHATPGEPCCKRWGRPVSRFHDERVARAAISTGTFNIAWCPECGLHGHRRDCHTCGGPVEQIPMRAVLGRPVEQGDE